MKFWLLILTILLSMFLVQSCFAQNLATVSGTLTDLDGTPWINATWTARPVSPSSPPVYTNGTSVTATTGQLSGTAVFSGSVPRTSQIVPNGTTLSITICSVTSVACVTLPNVTVTGTTVNLGSLLSPRLAAPRIPAAPLVYAYTASEVTNPINGSGYFNTTTNQNFLFVGGSWTLINTSVASLLASNNVWTGTNSFVDQLSATTPPSGGPGIISYPLPSSPATGWGFKAEETDQLSIFPVDHENGTRICLYLECQLIVYPDGPVQVSHLAVPLCTATGVQVQCGTFASGFVGFSAGTASGQISSTAIDANSQIFLVEDVTLSSNLGVTCVTTPIATQFGTRGAGFITINLSPAPSGGNACFSFLVVN